MPIYLPLLILLFSSSFAAVTVTCSIEASFAVSSSTVLLTALKALFSSLLSFLLFFFFLLPLFPLTPGSLVAAV